jgi:hypothetical protein
VFCIYKVLYPHNNPMKRCHYPHFTDETMSHRKSSLPLPKGPSWHTILQGGQGSLICTPLLPPTPNLSITSFYWGPWLNRHMAGPFQDLKPTPFPRPRATLCSAGFFTHQAHKVLPSSIHLQLGSLSLSGQTSGRCRPGDLTHPSSQRLQEWNQQKPKHPQPHNVRDSLLLTNLSLHLEVKWALNKYSLNEFLWSIFCNGSQALHCTGYAQAIGAESHRMSYSLVIDPMGYIQQLSSKMEILVPPLFSALRFRLKFPKNRKCFLTSY